jgi:hypothetical protein
MVCSVTAVALGLVVAPAAAEDCTTTLKPVNGRLSHSYEHWNRGSAWKVRGYGPGNLGLDRSVETSNTFSATAGITARDVTAAVGFDVTESETFTAKFEADLPDRGPWILEAGTVDEVFVFDIASFNGCTGTRIGTEGQGTAERAGEIIFRHYHA